MTRLFAVFLMLLLPWTVLNAAKQKAVSDDAIYDMVRRKLANDIEVKGAALEVNVTKGVVTVKGNLESEKLKSRAEKIARKVPGVVKVVNEIRVAPPGSR